MFPLPDTEGVRLRDEVNSAIAKCRKIQAYMDNLLSEARSLEEQCTSHTSPAVIRGKAADKLYEVQLELRNMVNRIEDERVKASHLRMESLERQYQEAVNALEWLDGFYDAYKRAAWELINAHPATPRELTYDPHTYLRKNGDGSVYVETPAMRAEYWIDVGMAQQRPTSYERVMEENIAMRREAQQHPELLEQWRAHPETRSEFRRQLSARREEELMRAPEGDTARRARLDW